MSAALPPSPLPVDELLAKLRASVAAVEALCEADASPALGALLRGPAGDLAAAARDLDALLCGGNALPLAWRDPSSLTPHDRLLWLGRRIWSHARDGAPVIVGIAQSGPGWLVLCAAAPQAVYGATPNEALRVFVSYGLWFATQARGAADATVARVAAGLAELGLAREPDAIFGPKACEPDGSAAALADEVLVLRDRFGLGPS